MYLWIQLDHRQVIGYSWLTVFPGSGFHRMLASFPLRSLYSFVFLFLELRNMSSVLENV